MQLTAKDIINNLLNIIVEMNRFTIDETELSTNTSARVRNHMSRVTALIAISQSNKPSLISQAKSLLSELKISGINGIQNMISPREQSEYFPVFRKLHKASDEEIDKLLQDSEFLKSLKKLNSQLHRTNPNDPYPDVDQKAN